MPSIGCWERMWDGITGRPEWFGARAHDPAFDNVAALTACFALCPVTQLGAQDYYIRNTLIFDQSDKAFVGAPRTSINPSAELRQPARIGHNGGSRVILTGPNVVTATVLQFGRLRPGGRADENLVVNSTLRDIAFCRDNRSGYRARNSPTGDAIDCVKGIVCAAIGSCRIENVCSFDSPIGWHCFSCVYTKWDDCSATRETPAQVAQGDFSIGFLIGAHAPAAGYAGANASVYFNRCSCYDLKGGSVTIGLKLFGAIADTYLSQIEVGRCRVGIEIDGRGANGATIPENVVGSQADIHIINPIIDQTNDQGLQLRNLNRSFQVSITSPYIVTAGGMADIHIMGGRDRVEGHVSIIGGTMLSSGGRGLVATDAVGINLIGTLMRNYGAPVVMKNCRTCRIEPDLNNYQVTAANGIYLEDVRRSSIKPIIRGGSGAPGFANGVFLDRGQGNAIDATMIDHEVLSAPGAAHAIVYQGRDARADPAFRAAGHVITGATG
jgi:hypothetical protein